MFDDGSSVATNRSTPSVPRLGYYDPTEWLQIIDLDVADQDKIDLLAQFQLAYNDLAATTPNIPTFAQVVTQLRGDFTDGNYGTQRQ